MHALAVKEDSTDIRESDLQNIRKVVSLCVGLVALNKASGEIRLVHETTRPYFQEYFRNVKNDDADAEIAITCLRYFTFPAFRRDLASYESLLEHMHKYKLSGYVAQYWFVHVREGRLEGKFGSAIIKTFQNQGTPGSVYRIAEYLRPSGPPYAHPPMLNLLHLASMYGLCILCREILTRTNKMQRLYFSFCNLLILARRYYQSGCCGCQPSLM
jgi:hypothetical protein